MKEMYMNSNMGWSRTSKLNEMKEEKMRYIVAKNLDDKIVGFCSFQFDLEEVYCDESSESDEHLIPTSVNMDERFKEVAYCYEIQVSQTVANQGIGTFLMNCLESIADYWKIPSIMLTVFKVNKKAIRLYFRLGFRADSSSPSQTLSRLEALKYDYEILEKKVGLGSHKK